MFAHRARCVEFEPTDIVWIGCWEQTCVEIRLDVIQVYNLVHLSLVRVSVVLGLLFSAHPLVHPSPEIKDD